MTLDQLIAELQEIRKTIAGKADVKVQSEGHTVYEIRQVYFNPTFPAVMIRTKRKRGQRA